MPETETLVDTLPIGSIRRGREIGQPSHSEHVKYVLVNCPDCGRHRRWFNIYRAKGRTQIPCTSCNSARQSRAGIFNPHEQS